MCEEVSSASILGDSQIRAWVQSAASIAVVWFKIDVCNGHKNQPWTFWGFSANWEKRGL
jgi:hypothetical protein